MSTFAQKPAIRLTLCYGEYVIPSRNTPARDLLDFYAETGVDALLEESPVDRFAATEPAVPIARALRPAAPSANLDSGVRAAPAAPPAPDEAVMKTEGPVAQRARGQAKYLLLAVLVCMGEPHNIPGVFKDVGSFAVVRFEFRSRVSGLRQARLLIVAFAHITFYY